MLEHNRVMEQYPDYIKPFHLLLEKNRSIFRNNEPRCSGVSCHNYAKVLLSPFPLCILLIRSNMCCRHRKIQRDGYLLLAG